MFARGIEGRALALSPPFPSEVRFALDSPLEGGGFEDIGDIPGEQCMRLPPVGAIVVEYLAMRELDSSPADA
jgi:hypothetical protein